MPQYTDTALTALAPIVWGSTYYVTTEFLPEAYPITAAMLRALPAGFLLLLWVRQLPEGQWWWRLFLLGALNFSIFWVMLFVAAYRLPGGVAATIGAIQPIIVIFLAHFFLQNRMQSGGVLAAVMGVGGVALLVLDSSIAIDPLGLMAAVVGAMSMALGSVLTKKWRPPVSLLTFTAWQLTAGGLLLVPMAMWLEPALPPLTHTHFLGFIWLGVIGGALSYFIWFRGIIRMDVSAASMLGFFSPLTAVILGWILLEQNLSPFQLLGAFVILVSIWSGQNQKGFLWIGQCICQSSKKRSKRKQLGERK